ncbi:MAG TPA: cyclopropane-fatty-acyl-phospholipid synthase family protein [Oligoflexia bacterium]|nr:cyclopropane-fatty-acyl-phospholipid synthase family protein [Oligoflexia bacterium]
MLEHVLSLAERGMLPDALIRAGIRALLAERLRSLRSDSIEKISLSRENYRESLASSSIALSAGAANEQHYAIPPEFFMLMLGRRLKYSCCLFEAPETSLEQAEEAMLQLTFERAQIADGMRILELGCGWGSFCCYAAKRCSGSQVTAVSNSAAQREFIQARARAEGLSNLRVLTVDMNEFTIDEQFDRIVSIEMFEHMRNYQALLARIASWLAAQGKLFVHIFVHREQSYLFETEGAGNWMGKYFFTGGMMPADSLLLYFQRDLILERHWQISGLHYQKTLEAWLVRLNENQRGVNDIFQPVYGAQAALWHQRWRMFLMACAELFGYRRGNEWFVSHYLFEKRT